MNSRFLAILTAILILAQPASASEVFGVEEAFDNRDNRIDVPNGCRGPHRE
jgi:hypothetical protein